MDIQKKYADALKLIESEKDKVKRFEMFMKYGGKLLEKEQKKTMDLLIPLIRTFIQIKNGNLTEDYNVDELEKLKGIKYEQIISIFSDEINSPLEDLLKIILEDDQQCPPVIFHRQIELYLEKLKKSPDDNFKIGDNIKNLLRNEKYQKIMDLNYLLLLFKIYGFQNGVVELNEILELKQELMQVYMDNHNYDKLVSLCNSYGQSDTNYWVQALNYFLGISINATKGLLEKYIKQTLDNLFQNESVSPLVLLEILNKSKERSMPFDTIKDVLLRFLHKTKESLTEDQRECEVNMQKIEKLEQEKTELQTKAKTYNFLKCSLVDNDEFLIIKFNDIINSKTKPMHINKKIFETLLLWRCNCTDKNNKQQSSKIAYPADDVVVIIAIVNNSSRNMLAFLFLNISSKTIAYKRKVANKPGSQNIPQLRSDATGILE